jgi:hypothetical protein
MIKVGIRTHEVSQEMVDQAEKDLQESLKALEAGTDPNSVALKKAEPSIAVTPVTPPPPEPTTAKVEVQPTPEPEPAKKPDLQADDLATKIAAKDAEIAELQRKIREQGGQFGGTLEQLRQQLRQSNEQMQAAMAEIKALKDKAATPQTPEVPDDVDEELRATMSPEFVKRQKARQERDNARLQQLEQAANAAKAEAEEAKRFAFEERVARYNDTISSAVPNFTELNVQDSAFIQWAQQQVIEQVDGSRIGLMDRMQAAAQNLDPRPIIAAVKKFNESQQPDPNAKAAKDEAARKAGETQAQREADAKAHGAPSAAAAPQAKIASKEAEEARARRERIQAYEAKLKSKQGVTQKDLDQYSADTDAELQASLSARTA